MMDVVAGVDIGTTNLKVGVFALDGKCIAVAESPCAPRHTPDGRVRQDPGVWWEGFRAGLTECRNTAGNGAVIRAIAISSQAQTFTWLDNRGHTLGEAVSWLDAGGDITPLAEFASHAEFYRHTGWPEPLPLLAVCKLAAYERPAGAARLAFPDGWLAHRLTGRAAVSRNLAAMSGLYSMELRDWWPEVLRMLDFDPGVLPDIVESGETIGRVGEKAARDLGAEELRGVPVVAGANDQTAAALGLGLRKHGAAMLSLGTAYVTYRLTGHPPETTTGGSTQNVLPLRGPYPAGGFYELLVCNNPGPLTDWVRGLFPGDASWEAVFAAAFSVPPGAEGVRCYPDAGPEGAPVLTGPHPGCDPPVLFRAVLEGLAFEVRRQFDALSVGDGVLVTGGGARNPHWVDLLATITGRTLRRTVQPHIGLWGTARCALAGLGRPLHAPVPADLPGGTVVNHPPETGELRNLYDRLFHEWLRAEPAFPGT